MEKPNIFLIIIDDLRFDHLGCYGYERDTSLNINKLAEKGVIYTNCYSNSYWSVPSHSSLFTGKLPSEHGVIEHQNPYFNKENSLVKLLKEKGYFTWAISNNYWINGIYGFDRDFDKFDFHMWWSDLIDDEFKETLKEIQKKDWENRFSKYLYALKEGIKLGPKAFVSFLMYKLERKYGHKYGLTDSGSKKTINRIKRTKRTEKPLFLFINLMEVHAPYQTPLNFNKKYSSNFTFKDGVVNERKDPKDEKMRQKRINMYDDCVRYVDQKIKELVSIIQDKYDNNIFIITSDHGELFGDNQLDFEGEWYGHDFPSCSDQALKVPLIVYGENIESNKMEEALSLADLNDLISSIIENERFNSKGFAISENLGENYSRTITDGSNRLVITENKEYYLGNNKKRGKLSNKLNKNVGNLNNLINQRRIEISENINF